MERHRRFAVLLYLDMVGSTYLKQDLQEQHKDRETIFRAFHNVLKSVENSLSQPVIGSRVTLIKESRVGDALLFAYKAASPEQRQAFGKLLQRTVIELKKLPKTVTRAAKPTALAGHHIEFRAGLHTGYVYVDRCNPRTSLCLSPTELISYDLDLVTKVANLSIWDADRQNLIPAISKKAFEAASARGCVVVADEPQYKKITTKLYSQAIREIIYSVVDFSIFDDEILEAVKDGAKGGKLRMMGWLVGVHEAPLGALLRIAIAPTLKLRLTQLPDPLLSRSHIVSSDEALVGQSFSFGYGGRHFLVGEHRTSHGAGKLYRAFSELWRNNTKLSDETESRKSLRRLAQQAARGRKRLKAEDLTEEWVMNLTGLTKERCSKVVRDIEERARIDDWQEKIAAFVNEDR